MDQLARENPNLVSVADVGKTHEDRRIVLMKVGTSPEKDRTKAVWIDAGIHAREWIAPMATLYSIERLVDTFKEAKGRDGDKDDDPVTKVDWQVEDFRYKNLY